jgi:hypothetical protein
VVLLVALGVLEREVQVVSATSLVDLVVVLLEVPLR